MSSNDLPSHEVSSPAIEERSAAGHPSHADLVFWTGSLSIHLAPIVKELAVALGRNVLVVAEQHVSSYRRRMGWPEPDFGSASVVVAPTNAERADLVASHRPATHLFSGMGVHRQTTVSMRLLTSGDHGPILVASEPWRPGGLRGFGRRIRYTFQTLRHKNRIDAMLAIGPLARRQFGRAGFSAHQVFPYAYFVERPDGGVAPPADDDVLQIVIAGELTYRKDPMLLLDALDISEPLRWNLNIIGSGPLESRLRARVDSSTHLAGRVRFSGSVPNPELRNLLCSADLLVLCSRFDGWGAVVNEALHAGARVCVSDAAGSSELVSSTLIGWTFRAGDRIDLQRALREAIDSGPLVDSERSRIAEHALRAFSASAGARYLCSIVEFIEGDAPRPVTPWNV